MAVAIASRGHIDESFAAWVDEALGADLRRCLHCGTCSTHCPLAAEMDLGPRRLMALARRGDRVGVLGSTTLWLCSSCYACTTACPRQIPVTDVMYALKRKALADGVMPTRREAPVLAEEFAAMVRRSGRITEVWLLMRIYLRSGAHRIARFAGLGLRLIRRGRVRLASEHVARPAELSAVLDLLVARQEHAS